MEEAPCIEDYPHLYFKEQISMVLIGEQFQLKRTLNKDSFKILPSENDSRLCAINLVQIFEVCR